MKLKIRQKRSDVSLTAIIEYLVNNCCKEDMKCGLSAVAKLTSRPYYTGSFSSANDVLSYIKETISSLSVSTSTINNLEFATAIRKDIMADCKIKLNTFEK